MFELSLVTCDPVAFKCLNPCHWLETYEHLNKSHCPGWRNLNVSIRVESLPLVTALAGSIKMLNVLSRVTALANLPVWANFYNHTELSHTTTTTTTTTTRPLEQPTLLDDLNLSLNPQPGWPSSTG